MYGGRASVHDPGPRPQRLEVEDVTRPPISPTRRPADGHLKRRPPVVLGRQECLHQCEERELPRRPIPGRDHARGRGIPASDPIRHVPFPGVRRYKHPLDRNLVVHRIDHIDAKRRPIQIERAGRCRTLPRRFDPEACPPEK